MKRFLLILAIAMTTCSQVFAQSPIKGRVVDEAGEPVVGATVIVKGTNTHAFVASDGSFTINLKNGDVLEFAMLGKKSQTVKYNGQRSIAVVLQDDRAMLDELVVVGYGTQKRQSITGAISKVDGDRLVKAPTQNVTNMMGGVIPGVISYQSSGVPGGDGSTLLVRGSGVNAIVDGVSRSIDDIDPSEIESISVLKDASAAAIYGLNSEAVMIITTKRGNNKPSKISYNGSFNVSRNAINLELLDAPGYAYYYNLGREMDGDAPIFSQEMVDKMRKGEGGWGNTNWYKEVFGVGINQNHTVSASGGNDRTNYFATLGLYNQEGNVEGYKHNRLNIRTNIESKISRNLTLNVGLLGRFTRTDRPGISANPNDWIHIGLQIMRLHPYVPKTWEGYSTATRNASSTSNAMGFLEESGYSKSWGNTFQSTSSLKYDVPFVKGLSAKILVGYDVYNGMSKSMTNPFNVMLATRPTSVTGDISYALTSGYPGITQSQLSEGSSRTTSLLTNVSVDYSRTFGKHDVGVLLLAEFTKSGYDGFSAYGYDFDIKDLDELDFAKDKEKNGVGGNSSVSRQAGVVGRINYSYDNKYLAEVSCRYDGSYVFYGSNSRWGVFPAASLGWRIDREDWFDFDNVDLLKVRLGSGLTGSVGGVGAYTYLNTMQLMANTAVIGGKPVSSLYTTAPGNEELTWQKTWQNNLGVDFSMWNGKLRFEGDIFYKYIYDMISSVSAEYPASWGGRYPTYENKNKQDYRGFEFLIEHRNKVNEFSYGVSLIGSYTYRRWLRYTDAVNTPDYRKLTGKEVGSVLGFIADGLFQSQEEIDNSATIPGTVARPGDIKYRDRNGDGKITYDQDMGYVKGSVYPHFEGGINFDAAWKGFDLSMKWTYAFGRTVALTGVYSSSGSEGVMDHTSYTRPFYHDGNSPKYLAEGSWTESNTDARFPRLSINPTNNNAFSSTWWYENGNYLRLKNLQIGYTLPKKWMDVVGFDSMRVFLEGTNLLTFSGLTKYNIDPEMPSVNNGYYPQQMLLGGGLSLQF